MFSPSRPPVLSLLSCWSLLVTFGKWAPGGNIAGGLFEGLCLIELSQSILTSAYSTQIKKGRRRK